MEELFFMANSNTLLALAYIREADNPLGVISNLILYCLHESSNGELRHDELKNKMVESFGLSIPNHLIDCCLKYLQKSQKVVKLSNGAGYQLVSSSFDIEKFNMDKNVLSLEEDRFTNGLCKYINEKYHLTWDKNKAIKSFSDLVLNDNFSETVLERKLDSETASMKYVSDTWYVKNYIFYLLDNKTDENYNYFFKVFNGLIVLNGITQIPDYSQNKHQKFRGTPFYFDTKILLRILGFSAPYFTETSLELVRLIQSEYEGKICVFDHVVKEIKYALTLAYNDFSKYGTIKNYEMDLFRKTNNYSLEDFKIAIDSIETRIKEEFNFTIVKNIDWNDISSRKNCIDTEALEKYISESNPLWSELAVRNDVYAIAQINIERNGNYSSKFGGKKKLPVFVTSNFKLISDIKNYSFKCSENNTELPWPPHKTPLISDYDLTCRLWLTSYSKEPISLNLIKSAYLYQQSDSAFFEKIINTYKDVKEKHRYSVVDLDYERFEKLKELIIENTGGDLERITDEVVAISFEELVQRQSLAKDNAIRELSNKANDNEQVITYLTDTLITTASTRFINKISPIKKFNCWAIKNTPWIIAVFGVILVYVCEYIKTNELFGTDKLYSLLPFVLTIVFQIIDKKVLNDSSVEKWLNHYKRKSKKEFENYIIEQLSEQEKEFQERIIKHSIDNTQFFKQIS